MEARQLLAMTTALPDRPEEGSLSVCLAACRGRSPGQRVPVPCWAASPLFMENCLLLA